MAQRILLVLAAGLVTACGGGDSGTGPGPGPLTIVVATGGGDLQTGAPGTQLATPHRVLVSRGGQPSAGQQVSWSITTGGGTLTAASSTTGANGIAETRLTLPGAPGPVFVQASLSGASGSPVTFTAAAVLPGQYVAVGVVNNLFEPAAVTVQAGGTVLFQWPAGSRDHNLIPIAPTTLPNAPVVRSGPFVVEQIFPTPGTYGYFCSVHATATSGSMRGQVIVQ